MSFCIQGVKTATTLARNRTDNMVCLCHGLQTFQRFLFTGSTVDENYSFTHTDVHVFRKESDHITLKKNTFLIMKNCEKSSSIIYT